MRLFTFFTLVLFCISATAKQYSIDDFVGVEIRIDNGWAGESLKLEKAEKGYKVVHSVFGSGIRVLSKTKYDVTKDSDRQVNFYIIPKGDKTKKRMFRFRVNENGGLDIYCSGYKLAPCKIVPPEWHDKKNGVIYGPPALQGNEEK